MGAPDAARKSNQPARWVAVLAMPDCRRCCIRRSCLQRWHHVGLCKHSKDSMRLPWWLTCCHALPERQTMLPSSVSSL